MTLLWFTHRDPAAPLRRLLGLGVNELRIVMRGDRKEEAAQAAAILPMREKGNQLICTIQLGNVAANSMVSILMADLTNGLIGFFASTLAIVLLGEIVPQSVCSRFPLKIGAATLPLFKIIFYIMWPVTKPVAWLLDKALGGSWCAWTGGRGARRFHSAAAAAAAARMLWCRRGGGNHPLAERDCADAGAV